MNIKIREFDISPPTISRFGITDGAAPAKGNEGGVAACGVGGAATTGYLLAALGTKVAWQADSQVISE